MRFEEVDNYVAFVPEDPQDVTRARVYVSTADSGEPKNGAAIAEDVPMTENHTLLAMQGLAALATSAANHSGVEVPVLTAESGQQDLDWMINLADQDIASTLADPA